MSENVQLVAQIGGALSAMAVRGDYAFIGVGVNLIILDVSGSSDPVIGQVKLLPHSKHVIEDIAVDDKYAYVAAGQAGPGAAGDR